MLVGVSFCFVWIIFPPREWKVRGKRARGRDIFFFFNAWNRMAVCLCWIAFAHRYVSLQCFQPSVCVVWVQRDYLLLFPTRLTTSWRCYGKCQRKKHTETWKEYKNTVSNCAGDCTGIAPAWLENKFTQRSSMENTQYTLHARLYSL